MHVLFQRPFSEHWPHRTRAICAVHSFLFSSAPRPRKWANVRLSTGDTRHSSVSGPHLVDSLKALSRSTARGWKNVNTNGANSARLGPAGYLKHFIFRAHSVSKLRRSSPYRRSEGFGLTGVRRLRGLLFRRHSSAAHPQRALPRENWPPSAPQ